MKYLVTGGAGFIGSNLIRCLLECGEHQVLNVDCLTYAGNLESLNDVSNDANYSFSETDIVDADRIHKVFANFQPDGVFHLAAETHVDRSIDNPAQFIQTNVIGTFNLLQAARNIFESREGDAKNHFRFLHVSTDEVYGSLSHLSPGFSESTPYDPHSPYSASKASSDHLVRAWHHTYGLPVLVTNSSNSYGPFQYPEKLIPVVILKALNGQPIPVYGNGEHVRDWLFVRDHAQALVRVMQKGQVGHTYNIGGNNERQNIELVRLLCSILDELHPIADNSRLNDRQKSQLNQYTDLITFVPDRPGHDFRYAIDATKINSELGWRPSEDPQSGLRKTVEWFLNNESWCNRSLSGEYQMQRLGLGSTKPFVSQI